MKLVIASNNKHKIKEIRDIIGEYFEELYSLDDLGVSVEVEETGKTFAENSLIKAKEISKITKMVAIADDSGLVVDCLNGEPGVYSARYSESGRDEDNNAKLLDNMKGKTDRTARFVSAITLYYPNGECLTTEGKVEGSIKESASGTNGFGYDPLFYCDELKAGFGEASSENKNKVSHRGRALEQLKILLENK